jgi:hypothetical protein
MIKSKGNEELKQKLIKLNSHTNYPSVTILYPVNQGTFGNGDNSERLLKDLLRDANQKLNQSSYRDSVEKVKDRLNTIIETRRYENDTRGVAIFISTEVQELVPLPFHVEPKTYVGYGFHVRDLVFAMNRMEEYLVLHISEKKVMTLRGVGAQLVAVEIDDMPTGIQEAGPEHVKDRRFTDQNYGGISEGSGNFVQQGAQEDTLERVKNFIVKIDHALGKYLGNENIRLIVMGVEKKLGYFKKWSKNLDKVIAYIEGNYDHASPKAIGDLAWPEVQKKLSQEKEEHLRMLEAAVGRLQFVSGISQAWQAAAEGRIKTLLVEKEFCCPAIVSEDGFTLDLNINGKQVTPDKLKEDAVDDLIELVLDKGGDIVFLENGKLQSHQHLAAITRY